MDTKRVMTYSPWIAPPDLPSQQIVLTPEGKKPGEGWKGKWEA